MCDNTNMRVHAVNLGLERRVILAQLYLLLLPLLNLSAQHVNFVLARPNLLLQIFELSNQVDVGAALLVSPRVEILILFFVLAFEFFHVLELGAEVLKLHL